MNATTAATSSVWRNVARGSRAGRVKEFFLYLFGGDILRSCHVDKKFLNAFRTSGAGKHRVHRDSCSQRRLGQSSRERRLHRLGDAVMDHLHRNVDGGLAGDENDATPIGRFHPRHIVARQAHAAHIVYLDNCVPIIIGDLLERLRLVYAHVIDKNIDGRHSLDTF